jgi:phosphoribosyl isomerase A
MNLIPVIDLLQGQVVRAQRGERAHYRPIRSALCASSEPLAVARILCEHCAARQLYVADLDALQGRPTQAAVLRDLLTALPEIELWLDAGFTGAAGAELLLTSLAEAAGRVVPVFGSESLASTQAFAECFDAARRMRGDAILSLDRRSGQRLDAAGCWDQPQRWPQRVIVMTLERVGADAGPDLETLAEVQSQAPRAHLFGAGGIRDQTDLDLARQAGAKGWLVASALHDLRLPALRC